MTAYYEGIPLVTDGFTTQRASNAERICMSWRHHAKLAIGYQADTLTNFDYCQPDLSEQIWYWTLE